MSHNSSPYELAHKTYEQANTSNRNNYTERSHSTSEGVMFVKSLEEVSKFSKISNSISKKLRRK